MLGACSIAFGAALKVAGHRQAGPWLVMVAGAAAVAAGVFRRDHMLLTGPGFTGESWHNQVHDVVSGIAYAAMLTAPLALARRFRADPQWAMIARPVQVLALASAAAMAVFASRAAEPWNGTVQRTAVTLALAAEALAARRMLTLPEAGEPGAREPPGRRALENVGGGFLAPLGRLAGMDVRDSANPVLASAQRWLDQVNARHPWNHNEHFHRWILRNLPARRRAAVDIGCGTGVLAGKLAPHFARVTGIDADTDMAAAASARLAQDPQVTIRHCRFEQFASAAGNGEADLITMVAVLHHLDLDDTLARIPTLLAPGGRLLVVGLARVNSLPDLAIDLISAAANPVMGLIRHPRPAEGPAAGQPVMPVRDPASTQAEITAAARAQLPGATVRRRLFFRYTLRWDKPPVTAPPPGSGNPAAR